MNLEIQLTEKLLTTFHLNVPERKLLPARKVKFSIIKKVIIEKLQRDGCFPVNWKVDMPFVGALLELNNKGKIVLYHKEEISVSNPQLIETIEYCDIHKAILNFSRIMYGHEVDGILIDYAS